MEYFKTFENFYTENFPVTKRDWILLLYDLNTSLLDVVEVKHSSKSDALTKGRLIFNSDTKVAYWKLLPKRNKNTVSVSTR